LKFIFPIDPSPAGPAGSNCAVSGSGYQ